jgi:hypothetical protein
MYIGVSSPEYRIKYTVKKANKKLRGFSPQANYTDRATAVCRRS